VFRSGDLCHASIADIRRLESDIGLKGVLDLRHQGEQQRYGRGLIAQASFEYYNIPLVTDPDNSAVSLDDIKRLRDNSEAYALFLSHPHYGRSIVESLETVADAHNQPIVFHCSAGKDRTGVLAAALLNTLGVADDDVVTDYSLTSKHMPRHLARMNTDEDSAKFLASLPPYIHQSSALSMRLFLRAMVHTYGSFRRYLNIHGANQELFRNLERSLLE
jgi:hypothetical protein